MMAIDPRAMAAYRASHPNGLHASHGRAMSPAAIAAEEEAKLAALPTRAAQGGARAATSRGGGSPPSRQEIARQMGNVPVSNFRSQLPPNANTTSATESNGRIQDLEKEIEFLKRDNISMNDKLDRLITIVEQMQAKRPGVVPEPDMPNREAPEKKDPNARSRRSPERLAIAQAMGNVPVNGGLRREGNALVFGVLTPEQAREMRKAVK